MDLSEAYRVRVKGPVVVSETVGDETIIMHHETGHYFDTSGTGSLLWNAITGGATIAGLAALLSARTGIGLAAAREAAAAFVETLLQHDLIVRAEGRDPDDDLAATDTGAGDRLAYAAPVLGVHTDLADLLLLDPIHEAGEAGWPSPPQLATP